MDRPGPDALTICIAEDRASCEPALRILVASLGRHAPDVAVRLYCPNATAKFAAWLTRFTACSLNPAKLDGPWSKYDIRPLALLSVLADGARDVV